MNTSMILGSYTTEETAGMKLGVRYPCRENSNN